MRLVSLALLVFALSACDSAADAEPTFGDAYRVVANPAPAVIAPAVTVGGAAAGNAQLTVTVEYGGGCEEHAFVLRSRDLGDEVEVWFVHDSRGDSCFALLTETLVAALPAAAAEAERLTLMTPRGQRISLR